MDLEGVAPEKINITNEGAGLFNTVRGGFSTIENKIEYSKGFMNKLTKKQQFNMLSHELKHCKQCNQILRTEGLGAKELARAEAKQTIWCADGLFGNYSKNVMKNYPKEEAEKMIQERTEKLTEDYLLEIKKNFSKTLEQPKISASSKEGLNAKKYIEATQNYKGIGFLGSVSKEYMENLLEKEAYAYGDKMSKWFNASNSLIDKIKDVFRVLKNQKK